MPSADPRSFHSVRPPPLQYSALKILVFLASPNSNFCIHKARLLASVWIPPFCTAAWKLCPDNKLVNHKAYLICFPSLQETSPMLPVVQCLKTVA